MLCPWSILNKFPYDCVSHAHACYAVDVNASLLDDDIPLFSFSFFFFHRMTTSTDQMSTRLCLYSKKLWYVSTATWILYDLSVLWTHFDSAGLKNAKDCQDSLATEIFWKQMQKLESDHLGIELVSMGTWIRAVVGNNRCWLPSELRCKSPKFQVGIDELIFGFWCYYLASFQAIVFHITCPVIFFFCRMFQVYTANTRRHKEQELEMIAGPIEGWSGDVSRFTILELNMLKQSYAPMYGFFSK